MTFDPATAYAKEWQFMDRIQDAVLSYRDADGQEWANAQVKIQTQDITRPAVLELAGQLGLTDLHEGLWKVWPESGTINPDHQDRLKITGETEEWVVRNSVQQNYGPKWLVTVFKAPKNA